MSAAFAQNSDPNAAEGPDGPGRYIVRQDVVVFRYLSRLALERFIGSDEYARIRALRQVAVNWTSAIVPALNAGLAQ